MTEEVIQNLCAQHGLVLTTTLSISGRGSHFVARVVTASGEDAVFLKQGKNERPGEICALAAWNSKQAAAKLLVNYGDGLFLVEWLEGSQLGIVMPQPSATLQDLGKMLKALHGVALPSCLQEMGLDPQIAASLPGISSTHRQVLSGAIKTIRSLEASEPVVLHGDMGMLNVLLTPSGPKVIDPAGIKGPAAMDIAQLAVVALGRTGTPILREVIEGYGDEPAGLTGASIFFLSIYLAMARAAHDRQMAERLGSIADEIGGVRAALGL